MPRLGLGEFTSQASGPGVELSLQPTGPCKPTKKNTCDPQNSQPCRFYSPTVKPWTLTALSRQSGAVLGRSIHRPRHRLRQREALGSSLSVALEHNHQHLEVEGVPSILGPEGDGFMQVWVEVGKAYISAL